MVAKQRSMPVGCKIPSHIWLLLSKHTQNRREALQNVASAPQQVAGPAAWAGSMRLKLKGSLQLQGGKPVTSQVGESG